MSKTPVYGLTGEQLRNINRRIRERHEFKNAEGRMIKYITPVIDTRLWRAFAITFRGVGGETRFDFRDDKRPMYDRINEWLAEKEGPR